MSRKRTDFRALQARRERAIARPELREPSRSAPVDRALIDAAIAAGRIIKIPSRRTRRP